MLRTIARFAHIKTWQQKLPPSSSELRNKVVNYHIPRHLINPISGRQTTIPLKLFDELYKNYYPQTVSSNSKT
jgi:hypothetical protein